MKKNGTNLNSQLDDIVKLDAQAKDQFEQYKADDLKKGLRKKSRMSSRQLLLILTGCAIP